MKIHLNPAYFDVNATDLLADSWGATGCHPNGLKLDTSNHFSKNPLKNIEESNISH